MNTPTIDTPSAVLRLLDEPRARLQDAIDPEKRAAARAEALAPFAPGQMYAFVPATEKARAAARVEAEQEEHAGERLFELEQLARACERFVEACEAEGREPLDPTTAWQRERRQGGTMPPGEVMQLSVLAELQLARFERTLGDALPSTVLGAYADALKRPFEQASNNLIRWVESRHGSQWAGVGVDGSATEAMAAMRLRQAITAAREARIPSDVKDARALIAKAYAEADAAKTSRIQPRRPALVKAS